MISTKLHCFLNEIIVSGDRLSISCEEISPGISEVTRTFDKKRSPILMRTDDVKYLLSAYDTLIDFYKNEKTAH